MRKYIVPLRQYLRIMQNKDKLSDFIIKIIMGQQSQKLIFIITFLTNYIQKLNIIQIMRQRRPLRSSPRREVISDQLDHNSYRIMQSLKANIAVLEEQNYVLKGKCKKLNQLEDKVQIVLRQNNQLLGQNEKMSRLLNQHKSQNGVFRNKLDQQISHRIGVLSQFQFKQKKMLSQIQNLNEQISELENVKNMQINEVKTQYQLQIQNLKRQQGSTLDVYQQQIRKLKQIINGRQMQNGQLSSRAKKQVSEFQYQMTKARQQREKLRLGLEYMQSDHIKDLESLRQRLDSHYLQQTDHLKRSHLDDLQAVQKQRTKLKDLIDTITIDNQALRNQLEKSSTYYQGTISLQNKQIDQLQLQLIELQKITQKQKADLEDDLTHLHRSQIQQIKQIHDDHLRKLQEQLISLESSDQNKTHQIQQLMREKSSAKNLFDTESNRLIGEIQVYRDRINELQAVYNSKFKSLQGKISEKDKQNSYLQQIYRDMKANSDSQIASLKELLSQKKLQLQKHKILSKQTQQAALQQKNTLQNQKQTLKQALKKEQKQKQSLNQNLENRFNQTQNALKGKLQSLISKINMLQKQNDALRKNIQIKDKQTKGLRDRVNEGESRVTKLQSEVNQYRQKLLQKDRKNNESLQQQKQRLQKSHFYLVQNMKRDHQAALSLEVAKQNQLRDKCFKKQKEVQNVLRMHKKMCDEVRALTQQQANKKNIDLKFPGATADLIATKNMFDVFLKTKVLDVCADVIASKENIPQQQ